jgi:hypothetical protein
METVNLSRGFREPQGVPLSGQLSEFEIGSMDH